MTTIHPTTESTTAPPADSDLGPLCDSIIELHRQRVYMLKSQTSLTLQIKAQCRRLAGGDLKEAGRIYNSIHNGAGHDLAPYALVINEPFMAARAVVADRLKECESNLVKAAKELPVWSWVDGVRGFGAGSLGAIIGEAGNLANYPTPSHLWKRLGLAVVNGTRQRKVKGDEALDHGYSPRRRSVVWNLGDTMIKGCIRVVRDEDGKDTGERTSLSDYGWVYLERKEYERPRVDTDGHAHNRAKRYMEKRVIRDLWKAWNNGRGTSINVAGG